MYLRLRGVRMILKAIGLLGVVTSVGCVGMDLHFDQGVKGSGKLATEHRNVSGFSKIDMEGAYDITVKVGPAAGVDLSGDDNLLKLIETKIKGDTLVVSSKKNLRTKKPLKVTITTPNLKAFSLEGAGDVDISGINESEFSVDLSGAGDLKASGQAKKLHATLSGAGDVQLYDLKSETVNASLSGTGNLKVWATKYLKASMSGVGDLSYKGHPAQVEKSSSGVGEVSAAD